jgi:hypothetical protein
VGVDRAQQLVAGRGLRHDVEAGAPQQRGDPLAHDEAVIGDHHAHGESLPPCAGPAGLRGSDGHRQEGVVMADRALFVGFGLPVRGREERAVEVFNEFVGMCGRMQSDGRIESMDVTLLDPHGGDLGGFFMLHGSDEQCASLTSDDEFRRALTDAGLIVENLGVVPAVTGEGVAREMGMYNEAVRKVGIGAHALAGAHNGG